MYVTGAARGRGLGRALCETLIARARALGYREMRLDTLNERVEALPLYSQALGFLWPRAAEPRRAFSRRPRSAGIVCLRRSLRCTAHLAFPVPSARTRAPAAPAAPPRSLRCRSPSWS